MEAMTALPPGSLLAGRATAQLAFHAGEPGLCRR
jgi:hypothetical protein